MKNDKTLHQRENSFYNVLTLHTYSDFKNNIHFHKSLEFILVLEGTADITMSNNEYTLKAGECVLVFPYRLHGFRVPADSNIWVATFSQDYIKAFYKPMVGKKAADPVFSLSDATKTFLTEKLINPYSKKFFSALSSNMELTLKSCLYAICAEYHEKVKVVDENRETEMIAVNILQYISEKFREDISLQSAAEALGYNYQYISRIFNQTVRYNFKTVLNQYRFEYALQLLRETDKSITDVAFESGFQSLRTFNRVSSEMFNTSPKKCRSNIESNNKRGKA